ncbi:MAG: histidine phosphatase family protein [Ignavibacteriae bacterium]|nr:histidine phosphatase family protein [Ignavibacteriota bacterium]
MKTLLLFSVMPLLVVVVLSGCCSSTVTTIIFVRHGERLNNTDTTSLSVPGLQRAAALRHVLDSTAISRIFVTEKRRTKQTAQPTAAAHSLTPIEIPEAETPRLVDSLRAHLGQTMLVVGHSNTVPQAIELLGVSPPPTIGGTEFDKLFILSLRSQGGTRLTKLQYGVPSP